MPKYSLERKEAVLSKLLTAARPVSDIAQEEGICKHTLYAWRKQARQSGRLMPKELPSTRWDKHTKFAAVLETASMNAQELSIYCREKGLYPAQLEQWRDACLNGIDAPLLDGTPPRAQVADLKKENKTLERDLKHKEKALAEAAALLVLAKKYRPLWEDEEK